MLNAIGWAREQRGNRNRSERGKRAYPPGRRVLEERVWVLGSRVGQHWASIPKKIGTRVRLKVIPRRRRLKETRWEERWNAGACSPIRAGQPTISSVNQKGRGRKGDWGKRNQIRVGIKTFLLLKTTEVVFRPEHLTLWEATSHITLRGGRGKDHHCLAGIIPLSLLCKLHSDPQLMSLKSGVNRMLVKIGGGQRKKGRIDPENLLPLQEIDLGKAVRFRKRPSSRLTDDHGRESRKGSSGSGVIHSGKDYLPDCSIGLLGGRRVCGPRELARSLSTQGVLIKIYIKKLACRTHTREALWRRNAQRGRVVADRGILLQVSKAF